LGAANKGGGRIMDECCFEEAAQLKEMLEMRLANVKGVEVKLDFCGDNFTVSILAPWHYRTSLEIDFVLDRVAEELESKGGNND
jgi:hypothetical protein